VTQPHAGSSLSSSQGAVLELGRRILKSRDPETWRALVTTAAHQITGGRAQIWLNRDLWLEPNSPAPREESGPPPTELMRRAVEERRVQHDRPPPDTTTLAVPFLASEGAVMGVLQVWPDPRRQWGAADTPLIEALASQAALGLQIAHHMAVEERRSRQLALVHAFGAQVANLLDPEALAHRAVELIWSTFGYYYVALFTWDHREFALRRRASAGSAAADRMRAVPDPILPGQGLIGYVAQSGQAVLANDVSAEPRYRYLDALPETRAELTVPVSIGERVLGVLDVQSDRTGAFDDTDLLVLRAIADVLAIGLEHARLYHELGQRAEQLAVVAEVSRAVASTLDQDALFEQVVTLIHERFGYPFVHLFTLDMAERRIVYRAGSGQRRSAPQEQGGISYDLDQEQGIVPWVARHGETVLANDVEADPRYLPSSFSPTTARAELAVPLLFGKAVLGVLDVQSDRRDAFSESDRFLVETLGRSIAVAVRNANLYRAERWRFQVATRLRQVVGLLSAELGLEQVLDAILTHVEEVLPCQVAAIWLTQDGSLCLSAVHGATAEVCASRLGETSAWLDAALASDEPTVRAPETPAEPIGLALGFPSDYSAIAAPLRIGDRPALGLLTLLHPRRGRYGDEARALITAFANSAAVAIENTRLYRSAQEQARISAVLLEIAKATQSLLTLDEVLNTVVHLVPTLANVDLCAIALWNEAERVFTPAAAHGLAAADELAFRAMCIYPANEPAFEAVRASGSAVILDGEATDCRAQAPSLARVGFDAPVLAPLLAQDALIGVLVVDRDVGGERSGPLEAPGGLGYEGWLAMIQGIAYQTAAAVENAHLRQVQQEEAYVAAALLQVAQAIAPLHDVRDILSTVARIAPLLVGIERCTIYLWDAETQRYLPQASYGLAPGQDKGFLEQSLAAGQFPLLDAAREQAQPVSIEIPGATNEATPPGLATVLPPAFANVLGGGHPSREARLLHAIPLLAQTEPVGVMVAEESGDARAPDARRLELLLGIASQAANAVQNARLQTEIAGRIRMEQELALARDIQQSLMPNRLPEPAGWEIAALCRPARQVGGDFYDVFELPDGRLGLVIADVADKGMPAALFMALTRAMIRAIAFREPSPAAVLAEVNDLMVPDARNGMFVTAIYGVLALDTGVFTYANAGHNPPLCWCSGAGNVRLLDRGELALGVESAVSRRDRHFTLDPGQCLFLFTDGVTEAYSANEGAFFGEERLEELLRASPAFSARELLSRIVEAVDAFAAATPQSDDITAIVLRRLPT